MGHPAEVTSRGPARVTPYVIEQGETVQTPNHGDVAAGFWCDCLPFTVTATVTISITTLDVITDCIMYRAFLDLAFTERMYAAVTLDNLSAANNSQHVLIRYKEYYIQVPLLLQIFLILALAVYVLDLLWMCWMFKVERKRFKDKRDGLPWKGKMLENQGSDFFIMCHTVLHDLPVSIILFSVQAAISCSFFLPMYHNIYYISVLTTLISVSWKAVQIIYNSGCLGGREEYICTGASWILRTISSVVISIVIILSSLNILLLNGWQTQVARPPAFAREMMEKVSLDQWLDQESVVMVINRTGDSDQQNIPVENIEIAGLREIFLAGSHGYEVHTPCSGLEPFMSYLNETLQVENCTAMFRFMAVPLEHILYFDVYFVFYLKDGNCYSYQYEEPMLELYPWQPVTPGKLIDDFNNNNNHNESDANDININSTNAIELTTTSSDSTTFLSDASVETDADYEYMHLEISHDYKMNCKFSLVRNVTLLLEPSCKKLR